MNTQYLIIGTSAAGLGAAIKLRNIDQSSSIICLTAEKEMPYNRCLLADYLAAGKTEDQVMTRRQDFFDDNNITLIRDARVVSIHREDKFVSLQDGRTINYDKLFVGVGRSGWVPEVSGSDLSGVFTFYGLNDTNRIISFIETKKIKTAVVVGAGLSGVECADALSSRDLVVHLIEREAHVLPSQFDSAGGYFLADQMKQHNVMFYGADQLVKISGHGQASSVLLHSGKRIETDMVVFAIGGRINSELAKNADLQIHNNGILVNQHMQTSDKNIFAGGDVCVVKDLLTGELTQSCLWPDAVMQGMVAAASMAGEKRIYPGTLVVTSSNIYDKTFVTCGPISNSSSEYKEIIKKGDDFYHKYLLQGGKLKGFAMVGNVSGVGQLRRKMLDGSDFEV